MKYFHFLFRDHKYLIPRKWMNKELKKFAYLFTGKIINVSGWKDIDFQGDYYKNYFFNANEYIISNFDENAKGLQGFDNEIYIDLNNSIDSSLIEKFDVVINIDTLEHIYDFKKAFSNLCLLTKDILILNVPFLQQMHGNYGDYWRFTPLAIKVLFEEHSLTLLYLSFNNHKNTSVYIFAIGSKKPKKWKNIIFNEFSYSCKGDLFDSHEHFVGCRAIRNSLFFKISHFLFLKIFGYEKLKKITEK